jgi:orotate phosphoribosyltransferase
VTLTAEDARRKLKQILRDRAVLKGDFVLSSGQHSNYYLDARLVTLSAVGSGLVGQVMLHEIKDSGAQAVAGPAIGADPVVASIAVVSGLAGQPIDGLIVRKVAKSHGTGRRVEGPLRRGMKVAIVEDTVTTGQSCLAAAKAVEEEGGTIVGVYALIDRNQGAAELFQSEGYPYRPVFTNSDLAE